ncbi:hypothetical protein [Fusobacterium ulcerans]|uniref:hypothetical protein n=1 Tax=Fusobacterium ulcerans TaxID=861 RepID=UPI001031B8D0|nr:hypothetical protein [Fusobacterium ulcerans]
MNKETIGIIVFVIVGIILLYRYKRNTLKEIVRATAYYIVIQAEEEFMSGQGKEKLQYAIKELKKKIPKYFAWLIPETFIINSIEDALKYLQKVFKGSKEKQLTILNKILETAANGTPQEILKTTKQMEQDVNSKGYIEGFVEGRTDFKGESNIVGGLRAGIKI